MNSTLAASVDSMTVPIHDEVVAESPSAKLPIFRSGGANQRSRIGNDSFTIPRIYTITVFVHMKE